MKSPLKGASAECGFIYASFNLCAAYLTGTKATRANVYSFGSAVYNSLNSTNVGLPTSVCSTVRVRYGLTENNALSANFAFCHA